MIDLKANAAAPLAAWAMEIFGRPFAKHGRGPDAFDCWGVVTWTQEQLGRPVRGYRECYREVNADARADLDALIQAERGTWAARAAAQVGDVALFESAGLACHVGVLCGAGAVLHALDGAGVVIQEIERRRGGLWVQAYRLEGIYVPR